MPAIRSAHSTRRQRRRESRSGHGAASSAVAPAKNAVAVASCPAAAVGAANSALIGSSSRPSTVVLVAVVTVPNARTATSGQSAGIPPMLDADR